MSIGKIFVGGAVAVACVTFALGANAATITGLYNTGVGNNGVALSGNVGDTHWLLNGATPYAGANNGSFPIGYWVPDSSTSRWITQTTNAADSFDPSSNGFYNYTLTFDLTKAQAAGASFAGLFAADNTVSNIELNTTSIGSGGGFSGWTGFAATSGDFVAGKNTLDFTVENYAQNGGNPYGLNVQFTNSVAGGVPEPSTWAMMLIGLFGLGAAIRGSRKQAGTVFAA